MRTEELLEGGGGLPCVVVRDLGRHVVADVGLADSVQHEGADEAKAVPIGGGEGTVGEGPDIVRVMREEGVGVLKEGLSDEEKISRWGH